jgi:hypothetical protein
MSEQLNEMPVYKVNQDYIDRLSKRVDKLRKRYHSYRRIWSKDEYRHITTNRRITREKYDEIRKEFELANAKLYDVANKERTKINQKSLGYVTAFIVMDKKQNPSLYPEWLSFLIPESVVDIRGGTIRITPVIDLYEFLRVKGNSNIVNKLESRINMFVKRYFTQVDFSINSVEYKDFDKYIKTVVNKEIKPRIKEIDTSKCLHSLVFRVRNSRYQKEVQIYPRFRDTYPCYTWSKKSHLESQIKNILREYGWINGVNYTSSTSKD